MPRKSQKRIFVSMVIACIIVLMAYSMVFAIPIVAPSSLNPGDTYRLAFVTSAYTWATNPDIAYYNNFVTDSAMAVAELAALGTTWSAIVSTSAVDARDNTATAPGDGVGVAIYNLGGALVAIDNADFWDGRHEAAIEYDESGALRPLTGGTLGYVWTGTGHDGTAGAAGLEDYYLGRQWPNRAIYGLHNSASSWTYRGIAQTINNGFPIYAISGVLTGGGPAPVPEPATMLLLGTGLIGLAGYRMKRHKK